MHHNTISKGIKVSIVLTFAELIASVIDFCDLCKSCLQIVI